MNMTLIIGQLCSALLIVGLFWLTHQNWGATLLLIIGLLIGLMIIWIDEQYRVVHSLLFMLILLPLSIFVVSSTGNTIGQGVVAALLLGMLVEMLSLVSLPIQFNQRFQAKKPLTEAEIRGAVIVFALVAGAVCAILVL